MRFYDPADLGSNGVLFDAIDFITGSDTRPTTMVMEIIKDVKKEIESNKKNDSIITENIKNYVKMGNPPKMKKDLVNVKVIRHVLVLIQYGILILAIINNRRFFCYLLVLTSIIFCSCRHASVKSMIIEPGIRAEGMMIKDSIFDGIVKYYSTDNNKLLKLMSYTQGVIEGPCVEFYPSGRILTKYSISNNELNGKSFIYDEKGNIMYEDFYYFGLRVGGSKNFENNLLKSYSFYSLDNKLLFRIDYDSIKYKKISQLESKFFFFNKSSYRIIDSLNFSRSKNECFLYLPNPPKFNFEYSLVLIDSLYHVKRELRKISNYLPWEVFEIPDISGEGNSNIAIQLIIKDTNMVVGDAYLLKKINLQN